ncbi:MAG: molybdopterin-dependent oxidoreductase, partial [Planctomycetia bacterium]|nr:molybdopterin-dependent oxidoreductase [Planctomycetia bacterium]
MNEHEIQTTCPYCGVGCGVLASADEAMNVSVRGDPDHPANFGRLCSKGAALGETVGPDNRLLYPKVDGEITDWGRALDQVAGEFKRVIDTHGPDAVAFYVSGQLLTEDYYVANKLMKGFIGSANIDTNSRLCMSSAVAGYKRAFGTDTVPCSYEDLERAKLIVLAGSNTAWCHPVLFQRIRKAKQDNPDLMVVVIDPRRTATCDIADLHLAVRPGSDAVLFNGLLCYLQDSGEVNTLFVERCTDGADAALASARESAGNVAEVAVRCGLELDRLHEFYRLFARTERVVTVFSQGINQFSFGTDKVNSIINCHLLTGRIGRPGMGPFSFTGQPNAMGGREVGGLANQLAAHMELDNPGHRERVQRFWQSPRMPEQSGLKAVQLFHAMAAGKVKAVWIMATNPAVSLPDTQRVRAALKQCEFLVVSDCVEYTDTTAYADVLLPAQSWGEKEGMV